jgi:sugar fermentation stimulation protein A
MEFSAPLLRGRLIQRYKRFLADVDLDEGGIVTVHVPNPGAMLGLKEPGSTVWLSRSADPKRKLPHTLELVETKIGLVGINTMHPNRLAEEAIRASAIPELSGYATLRREVKYDADSRIDILLQDEARPAAWVEVKNCHMTRTPGLAEFPDCVAARSAKHMRALARRVEAGDRAVVLWVIQMPAMDRISVAADIDPKFNIALNEAADAGVEVLAYGCEMDTTGIRLTRRVPWERV